MYPLRRDRVERDHCGDNRVPAQMDTAPWWVRRLGGSPSNSLHGSPCAWGKFLHFGEYNLHVINVHTTVGYPRPDSPLPRLQPFRGIRPQVVSSIEPSLPGGLDSLGSGCPPLLPTERDAGSTPAQLYLSRCTHGYEARLGARSSLEPMPSFASGTPTCRSLPRPSPELVDAPPRITLPCEPLSSVGPTLSAESVHLSRASRAH